MDIFYLAWPNPDSTQAKTKVVVGFRQALWRGIISGFRRSLDICGSNPRYGPDRRYVAHCQDRFPLLLCGRMRHITAMKE